MIHYIVLYLHKYTFLLNNLFFFLQPLEVTVSLGKKTGLVDGSQIEYFSDEFNELCTQVGAMPVAADNPLGAGESESHVGSAE